MIATQCIVGAVTAKSLGNKERTMKHLVASH